MKTLNSSQNDTYFIQNEHGKNSSASKNWSVTVNKITDQPIKEANHVGLSIDPSIINNYFQKIKAVCVDVFTVEKFLGK